VKKLARWGLVRDYSEITIKERMRMNGLKLTLVAASAIFAGVSYGQSETERFERSLEQIRRDTLLRANEAIPIDQRLTLEYGGYITFSYLSADDNNNDNHVLRQTELLGYARVNIDNAHEFFLRYRTGWRDFNEGDSFDGRGDEAIDGDIDRGYYRFDLARSEAAYHGRTLKNNLIIKAGRDLTYWGNGLTLAEVIDGLMIDATWEKLSLSVIAGVTPVRTVDFDSSRPNFDYNTRRGFYGAMLSGEFGKHHPYVFGLIQRDYNKDVAYDLGPVSTTFDYNSYYIGIGASGSSGDHILYGAEFVYEGGRSLSNSFTTAGGTLPTQVEQVHDDIQAWAGDVRIEYLFNDARRTRVSAEVILASGDDDRGNTSNTFSGNKPGTTDRAFNGFGLLNTGLAFGPSVSNMLALRIGGATFPLPDAGPFRRMQIGTDLFFFNKLQTDAPIDEATFDERYLGFEPDVYLNWQITSDVTLAVRYGIFFPNSDAFLRDDSRQFLYLSLSYAF